MCAALATHAERQRALVTVLSRRDRPQDVLVTGNTKRGDTALQRWKRGTVVRWKHHTDSALEPQKSSGTQGTQRANSCGVVERHRMADTDVERCLKNLGLPVL